MEPLVAAGEAEAFERQVQQQCPSVDRHLVVDLSDVTVIDPSGIRALVGWHTAGQRVGGTQRLAAAPERLARTCLTDVIEHPQRERS